MSCQDEVIKIGKKLEKMISSSTTDNAAANDLLNALKKQPMTLEVLQKTRIGMTVNNFRKACNEEEVVSLAKSLIKSWKKLLSGETPNASLNRSNSSQSTKSKEDDSPELSAPAEKPQTPPTPSSTPTSPTTVIKQATFPARASDTTDTVRLKCRDMLTKALTIPDCTEEALAGEPCDLAAAIEECIFNEFNNTESKYKNRVRSRVSNLRDTKNPRLRDNVLHGLVTPDYMAVMTSEEMASDDMKQLRAKFTKDAINDHQLSVQGGTETDLLKCSKCGKRKCAYNQVQTRSADEPMTTFVLCLSCGKRWKFC